MSQQKTAVRPAAFFDLMKFIGAFCIAVYYHYDGHFIVYLGIENPFADKPLLWALSHNSHVFVEMYFIISGALFAWAYKDRILAGGGIDPFLGKRILRIFPTVIITSVVMYLGNALLYKYNGTVWRCGTLDLMELCVDVLFGGKPAFGAGNTLNGPIWYINVLMVCYVFAYILTRSYKKQRSVFLYALPIVIGLMIQYSGVGFAIWNDSVARGLIAFFIGVLLGMFLAVYRERFSPRVCRLLRLGAGLELAAAAFVRLSPWYGLLVGNPQRFYEFLVFPSLIFLCYDCRWLNRLCSTGLVRWMGNISFGMYLWDFPIYLGLHMMVVSGHMPLDVTSAPFFVLVAALHIAAGTVSWYLIDNKLVRKLTKLFEGFFPSAVGT